MFQHDMTESSSGQVVIEVCFTSCYPGTKATVNLQLVLVNERNLSQSGKQKQPNYLDYCGVSDIFANAY
jgi:hypothetical protein